MTLDLLLRHLRDDYDREMLEPLDAVLSELRQLRAEVTLWRAGQQPLFPGLEAQRSQWSEGSP